MKITEEGGRRVLHLDRPEDAEMATLLISEVIDRYLTPEEAIPVCIDLAFADSAKLARAMTLLIANERLEPRELAKRLKRLPATMRALEGPAS